VTGLRERARRLLNSVVLGEVQSRIDQGTIIAAVTAGPRSKAHTVLLTTTGSGNIGDQAMFESYLDNTEGHIVAVVPSDGAFDVPPSHAARVQCVTLEHLLLTRGLDHRRDLTRFGTLLSAAKAFDILGADIMDGGYSARLSAMEWTLALASARVGLPTSILGFSWNAHPAPLAKRLARHAIRHGVPVFPRDPHSLLRFVSDIDLEESSSVAGAADVVFLHRSAPPTPRATAVIEWMSTARRVALVNVSALVSDSPLMRREISACLDALISADFKIVFVPHVIREGNDDRVAAQNVYQHLDPEDYVALSYLLTPSEVRALAARAHLVFTGRMHLGILSLTESTPSLIVATQGKVSGLMGMIGRPTWCLVPQLGLAEAFETALGEIEREGLGPIRATLARRLGSLREMARVNYDRR
jgi:polysaccharide pyruvyl transferase WcaK-like protein